MEGNTTVKMFEIHESALEPGKYLVKPNIFMLPAGDRIYRKGSYSLLASRLLGMSYAQYCRMCRDLYNAELYGKHSMYPVIFFPTKQDANKLIKILNKEYNLLIEERENLKFS